MIKKLIILVILGGLGYVGYLVWTEHLSDTEKATIKKKLSETGKDIKEGATNLAKGTAKVVKDTIKDDEKDEKSSG